MKLLRRLLPVLCIVALGVPGATPVYADTAYTVQSGDTLFKISLQFNVSMSTIMAANSIANANFIYVGQRLIIPGASAAPSAPASATSYTVQSGDTLSRIALRFSVSQAALMTANGIANANFIFVGQRLTIPGAGENPAPTTAAPAAPAATATPAASGGSYVIQSGDTLYKIALKYGISLQALIAANGLSNPNLIYVGQRLVIPGGSGAPAAPAATAVTPPATVTSASAPTATPTPITAPTQVTPATAGHLTGQLMLESNKPTYATNIEDIWFYELIQNQTSQTIGFGVLGVKVTGPGVDYFHTSWSGPNEPDQTFKVYAGCYGPVGVPCASSSGGARHRDAIGGLPQNRPGETLVNPGAYALEMYVCYSGFDVCRTPGGNWERLSGVTITAVNWTPTPAPRVALPQNTCRLVTSDPNHIQLICQD